MLHFKWILSFENIFSTLFYWQLIFTFGFIIYKVEYVYKNKEKGITIDFLLGRKDGSWFIWAGKDGAVNYDDQPYKDLETPYFRDAIMNSLDKIQELIKDVKENPDNWAQYYNK